MQTPRSSSAIDEFKAQPGGLDDGSMTIDLPPEESGGELVDGALIAANDEGGFDIDLAAEPMQSAAEPSEFDFDANLALIPNLDIDGIAQEICAAIEEDNNSRSDWATALSEGIRLLGTKKEKMTKPFPNACGIWDPMMAEACLRFWATFHGEMLPSKGPVKSQIFGVSNDETTMAANRQRDWLNYYFTKVDKAFYPDMDQLGFWLPLAGSMFKKVYQCPIKRRPVSPFIMPEDVIAPYEAVNIESAARVTVVNRMSRRDIKIRQMRKLWADIVLQEPTQDTDPAPVKDTVDRVEGKTPSMIMGQYRGDEVFKVFEVDLDLDLTQYGAFQNKGRNPEVEGLPLPYKLIIDKETQKAFALKRNWRKGDESFEKRRTLVHYKFLPGLSFYGFGYAHVLGSLATTGTAVRRQAIDAITLAMFPGGLKSKGMKMDNNNTFIGPSEFREIDTGGQPINQALTLIPRPELSQIPILMLQENSESARVLASNVEIAVGEGRQDAPVGTTLALMEGANKLTSASLKLAHISFGDELEIFCDVFGKVLPEDEPYPFPVQGGMQQIVRADFSIPHLIRPVSDPEIVTNTQRIMRAQAIKQSAIEAPQIHDLREAYRVLYLALDMDEDQINKILPSPQQAQPMDPLSENQSAIMNLPLKAGQMQDHESHIKVHDILAEIPAMAAHIAEHMAMKMRADVERILGGPLPLQGQPLPPEVEAQVAVMVAQAIDQLKKEKGQQITPDQIVMEEIKQEWAKINAKIAEAKGKQASDAYKARLKFRQADEDRDGRMKVELLRAAANTADNMVPPIKYVQDVLEVGLQHAPEPDKEGASDE